MGEAPQIRHAVLGMTPYVPGKPISEVQRELGLSEVVKLASNENPLGPSPLALQAVQRAAMQMHQYPDASGHDLKLAISNKFGVPPDQIVLGNGSDEIIKLFALVYLEPGDNLVIGNPSFVRYDAAAQIAGSELRRVPLDSEWRHDLGAMAQAVDRHTKLVFVANPHNPTGTVVDQAAIERFVEKIPRTCLVVLDEAYYEFAAADPAYGSALELLQRGANVAVFRTFSKSYGLAGIRVGYAFAPADTVSAANRAREPFNVNSLAQSAAIAALEDDEHIQRTREVNDSGLARVAAFMAGRGFATVPSRANFMCVDVSPAGLTGQEAFERLLRRGVIVRSGGPLGMPNHIRVSIGLPAEMDAFFAAFDAAVGGS